MPNTRHVQTFSAALPVAAAVLIGLLALVYALSGDNFLLNILAVSFLYAGLSMSWNIIGGFGGQFSLGHSVFFATGAYVTARLYLDAAISPWLSLVPASLLAAALAMLVSWPVFRLKGPFFSIATMAMTEVALALAIYFDSVTGGAQGLSIPFRTGFENMIFIGRINYTLLMLGFAALTLIVTLAVRHSRLGYELQAVRDSEGTAEAVGINVLRTKLIGMGISAALMAVGGSLYLMFVRVVDPPSLFSLFDIGVKVALIALIGGIGTTYGPLFGALLIVPLESILRAELGGTTPGANLIVLGLLLLVTALRLRRGIVGTLTPLLGRLRRSAA
ncbi:MAG: branched-chain amino acid ABC transporter permease [Flavobacteriaceae bacterium]